MKNVFLVSTVCMFILGCASTRTEQKSDYGVVMFEGHYKVTSMSENKNDGVRKSRWKAIQFCKEKQMGLLEISDSTTYGGRLIEDEQSLKNKSAIEEVTTTVQDVALKVTGLADSDYVGTLIFDCQPMK